MRNKASMALRRMESDAIDERIAEIKKWATEDPERASSLKNELLRLFTVWVAKGSWVMVAEYVECAQRVQKVFKIKFSYNMS